MTGWTGPEVIKLKALYPAAPWSDVLAALPRHGRRAIQAYACSLKLKRENLRVTSRSYSRHPLVQQLRDRRLALRLSIAEVAVDAGCDRSSLSRSENVWGSRLPSGAMLQGWAAALGLELVLVPIRESQSAPALRTIPQPHNQGSAL